MTTRILVEQSGNETHAALLEDGRLVQYFVERPDQRRTVGNIYKGRVQDVLPGMEAAFVNVGLERTAYLYGLASRRGPEGSNDTAARLQPGDELLVQVAKEAVGDKGARLTRDVNLPGRYLVLTPGTPGHISLSRRLSDQAERERLQAIAAAVCPPGAGLIVRTVAEGASEEELQADADWLAALWQRLQDDAAKAKAPALLYRDDDLLLRLIRDYLSADVDELVVAGVSAHRQAVALAQTLAPSLADRVRAWTGAAGALLADAGVPGQLDKALRRRVWLDSGGYLVVDQTEALTVIDVNSGKFTGKTDLAATARRLNIEAAAEAARQLRLRDIGGIVLIDFVDMGDKEDEAAVIAALEAAAEGDRNRLTVLGFTRLGLLELTRRKQGPTLAEVLMAPCPRCSGIGKLRRSQS